MSIREEVNIKTNANKLFSPAWRRGVLSLIWLFVALCLIPLKFAHAYLDPGTGSYAIQIAIGVLVGTGYTIKAFGGRIVRYFKGWRSKSKPTDE